MISQGNKVPADLRLLQVNMAKVDKSAVTGESLPATATTESTDSRLLNSANIALMGTL